MNIKAELDEEPKGIWRPSVAEEWEALVEEGVRIRRFITEGLTVFPSLRYVAMGGIGDLVFNGPRAIDLEELNSDDFGNCYKFLPHALIDLPTIQHYCQSVGYGPLSLPDLIIKPESSLKTITFHGWRMPLFCRCEKHYEKHPPIILGAINRYYCPWPMSIPTPMDNGQFRQYACSMLEPIIAMFDRRVMMAHPVTGEPFPYLKGVDDALFENTVIEIYDFVRSIDRICNKTGLPVSVVPDTIVEAFQKKLDSHLPPVWKGKVWLKKREEGPPCEACGLHPKDAPMHDEEKGH